MLGSFRDITLAGTLNLDRRVVCGVSTWLQLLNIATLQQHIVRAKNADY